MRSHPQPTAAAAVAVALLAAGRALGGAAFVDSGQSLGNAAASDVALADLDGDGDLDAFVVSVDAPAAVFVNQGGLQGGTAGAFADGGQSLGASSGGQGVALGDLDGDGDLDAFVVLDAGAGASIEVFVNQGGAQAGTEGDFAASGQMFGDDLQSRVALGALDGDAALDAFVVRNVGRPDKVWINDGSGSFAGSGQDLGTHSAFGVALGDLDGDGDLDAYVTGDGERIWVNQGGDQGGAAGQFQDSGQTLGTALSLGVDLGDVDGDGDLDALIGTNSDARVWVNQGFAQAGSEGEFLDSGQSLAASGQCRDVALGDLDGDGDLDAFLGVAGADRVWTNQGGDQGGTEGVFADSGVALGSSLTEGVALGDLDGDGDLDAFLAHFDGPDGVGLNQAVSACGNGTLDPGEQCDDGNTVGGDGCSAACTAEGGGVCPEPPRLDCLLAGKAKLAVVEKKAGKEKLSLALKKVGPETAQADLGDPVTGSTRIDVCLYDALGDLVAALGVDRAGQDCAGKPCWKAVKTSGYKYKDKAVSAAGVKKIKYKGGPPGKGKLAAKAKNNARKGQTALPAGIAAALQGALSARAQVIASDGACFDALLTQVKKADGALFKAKGP